MNDSGMFWLFSLVQVGKGDRKSWKTGASRDVPVGMPPPVVCITSTSASTEQPVPNELFASSALPHPCVWTDAAGVCMKTPDWEQKGRVVTPTERQGGQLGTIAPGPFTANSTSAVCWTPASSCCLLFHVVRLSRQHMFIQINSLIPGGWKNIPFNSDLPNEMLPFYKKKAILERISPSIAVPWRETFIDTTHRGNWKALEILYQEGVSKGQFKMRAYFTQTSLRSITVPAKVSGHTQEQQQEQCAGKMK